MASVFFLWVVIFGVVAWATAGFPSLGCILTFRQMTLDPCSSFSLLCPCMCARKTEYIY